MRTISLVISIFIIIIFSSCRQTSTVWLDDLKIRTFSDGIPSVAAKTNAAGDTMQMAGNKYERGVGVQTISALSFLINGQAKQFSAMVGPDDNGNKNVLVEFFVIADRKILFESGAMRVGDAPKEVKVDLSGVQRLALLVTPDIEGQTRTYANWGNAKVIMNEGFIPQNIPNTDEKYILTPQPGKEPKINSAKIFGVSPGNPFLYTITATGERPMKFSALHLPKGLSVDEKSGIITGQVAKKGTYQVVLKAENNVGEATKPLKIVVGDTIALTPPMGWNGWNSWAREIDRGKVIASANAMVDKGLKNHGWTYINIDDCWQGQRSGRWNALQPNEKFPRFREMIDTIHAMGLKVGLYSTPWISSYAGFAGASSDFESGIYPDSVKNNKREYRYIGKYRFEKEDALQMAEWGVDYLKYDWRIDVNSAERMATALKNSGRDIFYSISNSAPFANAEDWARICNAWRTGPDIRDSW
ncbi:MAG: NPCBM/NEW2 domain-containing protein, partial [Draconibacterium sp.]